MKKLDKYKRKGDLVKLTLTVDRKALKRFRKYHPDTAISRWVSAGLASE